MSRFFDVGPSVRAAFAMNASPEVTLPGQTVLDDFAHLRLSTTGLGPSEAAARILAR